MSLPRNESDIGEGIFFNNWGVPIRRNLVFSGFISSWFVKHHFATRERSSSSFVLAVVVSLMGKDRKTFESSAYDSRELLHGDSGRSFKYILKSKGESIAPCGTPGVRLRGEDRVEPIRTTCDRPFR